MILVMFTMKLIDYKVPSGSLMSFGTENLLPLHNVGCSLDLAATLHPNLAIHLMHPDQPPIYGISHGGKK